VDSKSLDAQSGHEFTLTAIIPALAGANMIYGVGMLDSALTWDYASALLQNEFIEMVLRVVNGIQVSDETLMAANLREATTVIILGDDKLDYSNRDAKVVLATLTVESLNPDVYTVVELVNESYVATCQRAKADEIIVGSEISSRLMLSAALNHSISLIITELLCYKYGNQLDKIRVPQSEIGQHFIDVLLHMKQNHHSIVVGIQQGEKGLLLSNPDSNYRLQANDFLIVIRPPQEITA